MNKGEIKAFLRNKKGYLKEGGKRLRKVLLNKGYTTTIQICKDAVREVNAELKDIPLSESTEEESKMRVLIYDIETSPNIGWFWRAGYKLNISPENITKERAIICVSYKWLGEDQVYNLAWDKDQCDRFLIQQFIEVMNEADVLVAHNGDRFDLKWIKTRALKHGLTNMLIDYASVDTLKLAKKKFNFNSNRLDYIAKYLGFEGKIKTSIGLWTDIVFKKDAQALKDMITYCDEDVRQLENVYNALVNWEKPKGHLGVLQGKTKQTSPVTGGVNLKLIKVITTNRGTVKMVVKDLDSDTLFEMSENNYNKYLEIYK